MLPIRVWCGYASVRRPGLPWAQVHRLIVARMLGRELVSTDICDHFNRDRLDNRRANLGLVTVRQSIQNRVGVWNARTNRPRGVRRLSRSRWAAEVTGDGRHHSELHPSPLLAALAAASMRRALGFHGEPSEAETLSILTTNEHIDAMRAMMD